MARRQNIDVREVLDSRRVVDTLERAYETDQSPSRRGIATGVVTPTSDPLQMGHGVASFGYLEIDESIPNGGETWDLFEDEDGWVRVLNWWLSVKASVGTGGVNSAFEIRPTDSPTLDVPLQQYSNSSDYRVTGTQYDPLDTQPTHGYYYSNALNGLIVRENEALRFQVTNNIASPDLPVYLSIRYARVPKGVRPPRT